MYMTHLKNLFICQWALRLLSSLAIVNNATMNVGVQNLFKILISVPLDIYPEVVGSIFNFLRNLYTISIVATPVYLTSNSVHMCPFLHILTKNIFF